MIEIPIIAEQFGFTKAYYTDDGCLLVYLEKIISRYTEK
jgi:hypothetical protein